MAAVLPNTKHRSGYTEENDEDTSHMSPVQRSRRQWNLPDGPRGLLRRMRSQLAEDGDPESQVVLAKALLDSASHSDKNDDGGTCGDARRQAVFWLTRASLQGHMEATELLQQCLNNDVGISEHNYHEVQQCLAMDRQEKLARKAAQQLFCKLSDGNDFVTSSMLAGRIRDILNETDGEKFSYSIHSDQSLEERYGGERFLEEHLTAAATSYHQGYLPPLQHFLPNFVVTTNNSRFNNMFGAIFKVPSKTPESSKHSLEAFPRKSLLKYLGVDVIKKIKYSYYSLSSAKLFTFLLLLFILFSFVKSEYLLGLVPLLIQMMFLFGMIISTSAVLINYDQFDEFKVWSIVLKYYCSELITEEAERKFQANWHIPILSMLLNLVGFLALQPFLSSYTLAFLLPLFVIFSIFTFGASVKRVGLFENIFIVAHISLMSFNIYNNVAYDFILNLFPPNILPDVAILDYVYTELTLWGMLRVSLGVTSLLQFTWLMILFYSLVSKGPFHTATLMLSWIWCNVSFLAFTNLQSVNVAVCISLMWTFIAIMPILWQFLSSILSPVIFLIFCLKVDARVELIVASLIAYVVLYGALQQWLPRTCAAVKQVLFWSSVCGLVLVHIHQQQPEVKKSNLKWDSFQNICIPSKETEARTMTACRGLEGIVVSWQGKVSRVTITSHTNWPEFILPILPLPLQFKDYIACLLGNEVPQCTRSDSSLVDYERCVVMASLLGKERCSLDSWSVDRYEVTVIMGSDYWKIGQESNSVSLVLESDFKEQVLALTIGETVEFEGVLSSAIGTASPTVKGTKIKCSKCKDSSSNNVDNISVRPGLYVYPIASTIFSFFFGPTFTI